ncbi:MAG TPA: thiol-disulfide isomerase, partial [Pseudomonas sp.]|nr:thiol-disulfide isomerase [Pseudomonas sp.]
MSSRRKFLLVSLAAVLWLGAMLVAYQWFQSRYIRPFEERTELFMG